jgi:putative zinc finger protein
MTDKPTTDKTPERDRRIALLALMATESEKAGACPADETLAAFIEGQLKSEARREMLAHLNHCPSCYYHWLEVVSYLKGTEPAAPRTSPLWPSIWQRFEPWFTGWKIAIPAAAVAALVCLVVWWPASPDLNQQISADYAAVVAQDTSELVQLLPTLPVPWEGGALGFSESQPPPPRQAFGAGVWAGRQMFLGTDEAPLPVFLSPPAGVSWLDTEWADYYAFGRWMVLLWALAKMDYPGQDWRPHQSLLESLLAKFTKRLSAEEEANRAIGVLKDLQPLMEVVQRQANEQVRTDLSRRLEITMQQLAP